mmetsp:Transcript_40984/g.72065  ORF Transcript_40984/g.72065 Transcript_40984/m.72065 type:complete len:118 (-) Transcript_40984:513-866(-)
MGGGNVSSPLAMAVGGAAASFAVGGLWRVGGLGPPASSKDALPTVDVEDGRKRPELGGLDEMPPEPKMRVLDGSQVLIGRPFPKGWLSMPSSFATSKPIMIHAKRQSKIGTKKTPAP